MKKILIVGATNIDIVAKSYNPLKLYEKNPGQSLFSYGGVARNICENLARLNLKLDFMTIIGEDEIGKNAVSFLSDLNVNVLYKKSKLPTSTFISILNSESDNYISISSMDIVDELDEEYLNCYDFKDTDLIVSDANSTKVAKFLAKQNKKLFIDATSDAKVKHIKEILNSINYLKCTKTEMQKIFKTDDIMEVINKYPNMTIIITNKDQPVIFNDKTKIITKNIESVNVVNAIGAGDSFSAGIIYGLINEYNIEKCVEIAIKISAHSIQQSETVSRKLNRKLIGE